MPEEVFICAGSEVVRKKFVPCLSQDSILTLPAACGDPSAYIAANTPAYAVIIFMPDGDYNDQLPPAVLPSGQVIACQTTTNQPAWWNENLTDISCVTEKEGLTSMAILAQWHPYYLDKGRHWLQKLAKHPRHLVCNWMADEIGKYSLVGKVAEGVNTCVYFGHGRPGKLVGYHGITADDFAVTTSPTIGGMLSFSCYATMRNNEASSFGEQLLNQGKAHMFWGSREASEKKQNSKIEHIVLECLRKSDGINMVILLRKINHRLVAKADAELLKLWQSYTLLGNPFQIL